MTKPSDSAPGIVATLFHQAATDEGIDEARASFLSTIAAIQADHSALPSSTVLRRPSPEDHTVVQTLVFTSSAPLATLRTHPSLRDFERQHNLRLVLQPAPVYLAPKRLAIFDMDSTLIEQEVIDLLAATLGPPVSTSVAEITARAMDGELDFAQSLRARVAQLRGVRADVFDALRPRISVMPGARALVAWLRARGVKTAVLSGGFVPLARWLARELGIDHVHANELDVDAETGLLTGELAEGVVIVDAARKRALLEELRGTYGLAKEQVLAVGDGANDLPMLWAAGLGVAVNAKAKVQLEAPARLNGYGALEDVRWLCCNAED